MVSFPIRTVIADEGDYELVVETRDLYNRRVMSIDEVWIKRMADAIRGAYRTRLQRELKPHLDGGMGTELETLDGGEWYHSAEPLEASVRHWELVTLCVQTALRVVEHEQQEETV